MQYLRESGHAIVVSRPRSALRLGHVAWGYTDASGPDGVFTFGGVEDSKGLPVATPAVMEFWQESEQGIGIDRLVRRLAGLGYERFKTWPVGDAQPERADSVADQQSRRTYVVVGNNCLDSVHKILTAYGATDFHLGDLRHPTAWVPNAWYRSIPVPSRPLAELKELALTSAARSRAV